MPAGLSSTEAPADTSTSRGEATAYLGSAQNLHILVPLCVCVCGQRKAGGRGDAESPWQSHCWPLDTILVQWAAPALLTKADHERRNRAERRGQPTAPGRGGWERKSRLVQKKVTLSLVTQRAKAACDDMRPDG